MVKLFHLLAPLLLACIAQGCMQDWNNQCNSHQDCCSGNCERGNPNWATGVCKPGNGGGGNNRALVSQQEFNQAVTSSGFPTPRQHQYNGFINGLQNGQISNKREAAMALAQLMHESMGLQAKEEIRCQNSKCPSEYRTNGCDAPGKYYYGRGYIQLTWCENYRAAGRGLGRGDQLVNDPDSVAWNEQLSWDTAFWYWRERVRNGQYGSQVQNGMFGYSTRAINGALECRGENVKQSKKRFEYYQNAFRAFGVAGRPDERGCYN